MVHHHGFIRCLWWHPLRVSLLPFSYAPILSSFYRYDTGTIGGVIAMEDWLTTFGTPTTLTGVAGEVNGHYLAANNKSLVVCPSLIYPSHNQFILLPLGVYSVSRHFCGGSPRIPSRRQDRP